MNKTTTILIISGCIAFLSLILILNVGTNNTPTIDFISIDTSDDLLTGPAPYEGFATNTSIQNLGQSLALNRMQLYQPTILPIGFHPMAVLVSNLDGASVRSAMLVYSEKGITNVSTAELIVQVVPLSNQQFTSVTGGKPMVINDWEAYVNDHAYIGWPEYKQLYGSYATSIEVKIENIVYSFRAIPSITLDDLIKIVESMKPVI